MTRPGRLNQRHIQYFDDGREHDDLVFPHTSALGWALGLASSASPDPLPPDVYDHVFPKPPPPPKGTFGFETEVWDRVSADWDEGRGVYEGEQGFFWYVARHPEHGLFLIQSVGGYNGHPDYVVWAEVGYDRFIELARASGVPRLPSVEVGSKGLDDA